MAPYRFRESIDEFHARASETRGLDDFGEDDYREALDVLCTSLDEDAHLTPLGEIAQQTMIVDAKIEAETLHEMGKTMLEQLARARNNCISESWH